jgi:bifunctional DNase/RNase
LFCELFSAGPHHGYRVVDDAIPSDAMVLNARLGWPFGIELLIASDSFAEVHDGQEIPDFAPLIMNGMHSESPDA